MTFSTKTCQTYKAKQNDLVFPPKCPNIIFLGRNIVVWHERGLRKLQVKISWLFHMWKPPKLEKLKTKPIWLGFAHETYPHSFLFIPIISHHYGSKMSRSKFHNLRHEKPLKLETNPRWLRFVPQTFPTTFLVILLLFPINAAKKCFCQNFITFDMKTRQTFLQTNPK